MAGRTRTRTYFKVVPPTSARPLTLAQPPIPGESFLGLAYRNLSLTPLTRFAVGFTLAGIDTSSPSNLTTRLRDPALIAGVARLLDTTEGEIASRLHAPVQLTAEREGIDFFGTPIRLLYREHRFRRVSPRALAISPHYRAIGDVRPLAFDSETLETLIHSCPVCHHPLIWDRVRGICNCPHCVDGDGKPAVDLRDFKQPLIETDDPDALMLAPRLLSHNERERQQTIASLPAPWSDFSSGELFETLLVTARVMRTEAKQDGPGNADIADIGSVPFLAEASRMILEGTQGLATTLRTVRDARVGVDGIGGRHVELGGFFAMTKDPYLSERVRDVFTVAVKAETAERPITFNWDRLLADGRTNLTVFEKKYHMRRERLVRLLQAGIVPFVRGGHRGTTVRVFPEDIEPILEEAKASLGLSAMAKVLGVNRGCVEMLARMGQITRASDAVTILHGRDGPAYLSDSADELLERVLRNSSVGIEGPSVMEILENSPRHVDRFGAALAILASRGVPFTWYDFDDDWANAILIEDVEGFLELMDLFAGPGARLSRNGDATSAPSREVADSQLVGYVEAARILGTNQFIVRDLGREGFLPRAPSKYTLFKRSDVERFREEHIFGREMARALGNLSPKSVSQLCDECSITPSIQLKARKALIFGRNQFEAALPALRH